MKKKVDDSVIGVVCRKCGDNIHRRVIGFDSKQYIEPGKNVSVVSRPQLPFKSTELYINFDVARHFDILDIRVGYTSYKLNAEPFPATFYSRVDLDKAKEKSGFQPLDLDFAQVGSDITIEVHNIGIYAVRFKAMMYGEDKH